MKALTINNLVKTYSNGLAALKEINIGVDEGDFFALLGPNGAGKTTLIGILAGLVNKTSGNVNIFGNDIDKQPNQAKKLLGLVPQEFNFSIFEKVAQIIINQAGYYGLPKALALERTEKYLTKLDLWHKRNVPARMLSGGMKRRLMIARALVHEPKLLILDEPTAGVDIELRRSMWDFLRELNQQGTTIILTTHYLEEAESLCRDIAIIDRGEIIEHTRMSKLLARLHTETFIFYLQNPITQFPELSGYSGRLVDDMTLEINLKDSQDLNHLFSQLSQENIVVNRMRNKTNRLEELFMNLITE